MMLKMRLTTCNNENSRLEQRPRLGIALALVRIRLEIRSPRKTSPTHNSHMLLVGTRRRPVLLPHLLDKRDTPLLRLFFEYTYKLCYSRIYHLPVFFIIRLLAGKQRSSEYEALHLRNASRRAGYCQCHRSTTATGHRLLSRQYSQQRHRGCYE